MRASGDGNLVHCSRKFDSYSAFLGLLCEPEQVGHGADQPSHPRQRLLLLKAVFQPAAVPWLVVFSIAALLFAIVGCAGAHEDTMRSATNLATSALDYAGRAGTRH